MSENKPQQKENKNTNTNVLALVSLILSIASFVVSGGLLGIVSLVLALIAKNQIKQTGEEGDNLATIAIILSAIQILIFVVIFVGVFGCMGLSFAPLCCMAPFAGMSE